MLVIFILVRMKGLEPSRLAAHAPKACVSTNSTTSAYIVYVLKLVGTLNYTTCFIVSDSIHHSKKPLKNKVVML